MNIEAYKKAVIAAINAKHVDIHGTALANRNNGAIAIGHSNNLPPAKVADCLVAKMHS